MPATGFTSADTVALGKMKTFALLGIIGILLGVIVPAATGAGLTSLFAPTSLTGSATLIIAGVVISLVGFIIGIVSILQVRAAFKTLASVDQGFSTPSKLVLGLFGGLALFVIAFIVLIAGLMGSIGAAASGTFSAGILATLAVAGVLFIVAAILALIGIIGIILGLWRAGERYQEGLVKIGGILFIIPYADIVAPFLVYFGVSSAQKKVAASMSSQPH
jgi:hypothetical protein